MNFEKICSGSRKPPRAGDVFRLRLPSVGYLFGRVVDTDAVGGGFPGILIYLYDTVSGSSEPPLCELRTDRLLIPPVVTNSLGWVRGVFETVMSADLRPEDTLVQHCFLDRPIRGPQKTEYFDEKGVRVSAPTRPCGDYVLHSYRSLDDVVSTALGVPRSLED